MDIYRFLPSLSLSKTKEIVVIVESQSFFNLHFKMYAYNIIYSVIVPHAHIVQLQTRGVSISSTNSFWCLPGIFWWIFKYKKPSTLTKLMGSLFFAIIFEMRGDINIARWSSNLLFMLTQVDGWFAGSNPLSIRGFTLKWQSAVFSNLWYASYCSYLFKSCNLQ